MPVEQIGLDDYVKRYEGDTAIRNIPTNEEKTPDYSNYRPFPYTPYERTLIQDEDRWTNPASFSPTQKSTWERTFDSDPGWRLNKGYDNSWSYAPDEPTSQAYRQEKNVLSDVVDRMDQLVKPDTGTYSPRSIPMRGGPYGNPSEWSMPIHFDPSRSLDMDMASYPGTGGQPRPAPPFPSPTPGQLPGPPGTSGYGPVGQMVSDVFSPAPPGVDWRNLSPTNLLRGLRQGVVSDEDIAEIKRNPYGLTAAATAVNIGIALSRGAGRGENLNWRIVPIKEWNGMKTPEGMHGTVKVDDAGNYYKATGTHEVKNPDGTSSSHVIANPVPGPSMYDPGWAKAHSDQFPTPGSPEWFAKKAEDFQAKHGLPPPDAPYPGTPMAKQYPGKTWKEIYELLDKQKPPDTLSEAGKKEWPNWNAETKQAYLDAMAEADKTIQAQKGPQDLGAVGSGPTQQWHELAPEVQRWFKDQYGLDTGAAEKKWNESLETKPATPKEIQDMNAYMDQIKNKPKMQPEENFPKWDESHGVKEAKFDDAGHVDTLREYATRNNLSAEEYHKLLDASLAPKESTAWKDLTPGQQQDFMIKYGFTTRRSAAESWNDFLATGKMPPEKPPKNIEEQYTGTMLPEDVAKLPEVPKPPTEGVGPVDWNWYSPKGEPPTNWGNLNDRKYSGPLTGQTWADIYATPDIDFTVGGKPPLELPPDWNITGEDMGPRSSDFWDRFNWKPPPEEP